MAIFNSYVSLPEGTFIFSSPHLVGHKIRKPATVADGVRNSQS